MSTPRAIDQRSVWGILLERSGLDTLLAAQRRVLRKVLPANLSWIYTTGALALFFFALQFATGCLLLTVYVPDEAGAFASVQTIEHQVKLGWLIRQMHSWGASFVVLVLLLHVIKVLWYGSYKRPREFTWFVGVVLFGVTLSFCFSGYLLPWNQLSFWATRVALEAIESVPFVGVPLKTLICGGPEVSGATLGRFFAFHVIVLPLMLIVLVAYHLFLITRHGTAPRTTVSEELALGCRDAIRRHGGEPFFPRQVYRDLIACNIGFAILVTVAVFFPWEIGEPASLQTPKGIKPEWYFLPTYQFVKYFDDKFHALLIMGGAGLAFFLLPLLDRGKERRILRRPIFAIVATLALVGVIGLGVVGWLADRTVTLPFSGTTIQFDTLGRWSRVSAGSGVAGASDGGESASSPSDASSTKASGEASAGDVAGARSSESPETNESAPTSNGDSHEPASESAARDGDDPGDGPEDEKSGGESADPPAETPTSDAEPDPKSESSGSATAAAETPESDSASNTPVDDSSADGATGGDSSRERDAGNDGASDDDAGDGDAGQVSGDASDGSSAGGGRAGDAREASEADGEGEGNGEADSSDAAGDGEAAADGPERPESDDDEEPTGPSEIEGAADPASSSVDPAAAAVDAGSSEAASEPSESRAPSSPPAPEENGEAAADNPAPSSADPPVASDEAEKATDAASEAASGDEKEGAASAEGDAAKEPEKEEEDASDAPILGGTCLGCHEGPAEEWEGSVHAANGVACVDCHGGNDTPVPESFTIVLAEMDNVDCRAVEDLLEDDWPLFAWAHQGIKVTRNCPNAPRAKEIPDFCGKCHIQERGLFSPRHMDSIEHGVRSCRTCHSNHDVAAIPADLSFYDKGYTDTNDPRTADFLSVREAIAAVDAELRETRGVIEKLDEIGFPIASLDEELAAIQTGRDRLRPLVHALDPKRVREGGEGQPGGDELIAKAQAVRERARAELHSRDDRWVFVAGVWGVMIAASLFLARGLRRFPRGAPGVDRRGGGRRGRRDLGCEPRAREKRQEEHVEYAPPSLNAPLVAEAVGEFDEVTDTGARRAAKRAEKLARGGDERGALLHPLSEDEPKDEGDKS